MAMHVSRYQPQQERPRALVSNDSRVVRSRSRNPVLPSLRWVRGHGLRPGHVLQHGRYAMSQLNTLMGRGIIPPVVHGVLDYPLAAVLLVLPLVLGFDDVAATWIAFAFGIGAAVLAVGTAWSTGIVRVIPPLLHGYADIAVT